MATLLSSLETQARVHMKETVARYWTSAELIAHINNGIKDMWGGIVDLNQEHYLTVDVTNVSQAAAAESLTGVPADCFRVHLIEPRDTTVGVSGSDVAYVPRDYNSHEFRNARQLTSQDPMTGVTVYYALTQPGAPIAAPTVLVSPKLSSALTLRFVYVPTLALLTAGGTNPIPGESDNALIAWCVAYGRAKGREDNSPDPNWLAIYGTEKTNVLVRLTPRQTQEPEIVDGMFDAYS